jgi:hypothetical protein
MPNAIYISEQYPNLPFDEDWELLRMPPTQIPPRTFGNPTWAGQLAGLLGRVIPEGPVLVIAFPVAIQSPATRFLERFGISYGGVSSAEVDPVHPAFTGLLRPVWPVVRELRRQRGC